jgi:hypothetical protein
MGAIRVSSNGRYFVDDQGNPFFWLGDTLWELFRAFTPDDARAILEHRKNQGFTVIQVMLTGVGDGTKPNSAGQTPWVAHNPAHPNEAYFRNVDHVVDFAGKLGLVLIPGVYHQVQRSAITMENARGYARWLAERYRDVPHIVWTMYPEAKKEFIPAIREVVAGLHEGDGGAHMITMHPDPSPASSSFMHDEEWLAFNMIQPWQSYELQYPMVSVDYRRQPPKPVIMAEGGYEGVHYTKVHTPWLIRRQAYWAYLAGGFHTYGHASSHLAPPETWRSWIDSPGAIQMGLCRQILTGLREWWNLVPDQSLLAAGEGSGMTLNVAARCPTAGWALVYLSSNTTVSVRLERAGGGRPMVASWTDPTSGAVKEIGSVPGTGVESFSTPDGREDALLLFKVQEG